MNTKVIVNPHAASRKTGKQWPALHKKIIQAIGEVDVAFTQRQGHATQLTRLALQEGYDYIIAVGGDGTLSEVVNGFFEHGRPLNSQAVFSFIMRGTGCDFRKTLGQSGKVEDAIQALAQGTIRKIDVGQLTYLNHQGQQEVRYFDNIASLGMGGEVDRRVNESSWSIVLGGTGAFLAATLQTLAFYRNPRVRLQVDEHYDVEAVIRLAAVANGQFGGGGMWLAPQAKLDDGWFDVIILGDINRRQTLLNISQVYQGTHLANPQVVHLRGKKVVATSAEEVLLDVDGEAPGRLPATFEILPGAIQLKC